LNAHTPEAKNRANALSNRIVGAAIEVHSFLGPGLLESAYKGCLCREFILRDIPHRCQVKLPLEYKGVRVDQGYAWTSWSEASLSSSSSPSIQWLPFLRHKC
jgi:hypothetical protein